MALDQGMRAEISGQGLITGWNLQRPFFLLPFLIRTFNPRKSVLHRNTLHGGLLGGISLSVSQLKSCGWR